MNKWKRLLQKKQLIIILLVGILLVVIAIPTDINAEKTAENKMVEKQENTNYKQEIEKELETVLRKVEGVGNVDVMITYKGSAEKIVEKDEENTTVYSRVSGGEESPYVKQELMPEVEGVVVIAQGGANAVVVKNITEAVQALFNVDTHKIKIMKGG